MDVTCNRCNTEYEFEEALVSSRGTTVKCTHCGHLFKVQRAPRIAAASSSTHWTLRQTDGRTHVFDDLAELPQSIAEGKFGRDDELSRTGKLWRRLGDIEELDAHFVSADRRGPSRVQAPRQIAQRQPKPEPAVVAPTPAAAESVTSAPAVSEPQRARIDTLDAVEALRAGGVRHESRFHAWARLLASAAIVVAVGLWFFSLPPSAEHSTRAPSTAPVDPSVRFLAAAERALAPHRIDQFDQALVEYIKALAYHEHDVHILSGVSRVHALWSQELLSQHELSKHTPEHDATELEAQAHALQAKRYAELALRGNPGNSEAQLATSDALRLNGELPGARAALESALTQGPASAEALRVSALLTLRETDANAASEIAARAVAADPSLLAARLLLARLLFQQADADATRVQLQAIAAQAPQHPEALRLEALLSESPAPAAQAIAEAAAPKAPASESEAESFIERGRALLEAGQANPAKRAFEHALTLQPGSVAAHAGLGQVALARGRPVQAIDHLVAAALAGDGDSLITLADLYRRLGRQREALTAYQSYLQQNPNGPQLDVAKTQLARLGEQFASARKP